MGENKRIEMTFEQGEGIFRLIPSFVPRYLGQPGKRLKLHPDDYFAYGINRGPIKERWLSSVIRASNGPYTLPDEGMSYVSCSYDPNDKFLLKDAVDLLGKALIGEELAQRFGNWPMYSKFFDYETPIFFHLHLDDKAAGRVNRAGKPEAYYYPLQLNNYPGMFPVTYFGFDPDISREEVIKRLIDYEKEDIKITEISRGFRIELGTGWYTPPGVLHAPGSYLTYEPQWNSDINAVFENYVAGETFPYEFLVENCPEDKKRDIEYIMSLIDWDTNVDPHYRKKYFRPPVDCVGNEEGYAEKWVVYANDYIAAKELEIKPGCHVTVKDQAAYGCVVIQGHGKFGVFDSESAGLIRFGALSADEFFVSEDAARKGVEIKNNSLMEPMVILKHFGPNHPGMPKTVG